jgi:hypothetical protein
MRVKKEAFDNFYGLAKSEGFIIIKIEDELGLESEFRISMTKTFDVMVSLVLHKNYICISANQDI